jgi:hypothetical protein
LTLALYAMYGIIKAVLKSDHRREHPDVFREAGQTNADRREPSGLRGTLKVIVTAHLLVAQVVDADQLSGSPSPPISQCRADPHLVTILATTSSGINPVTGVAGLLVTGSLPVRHAPPSSACSILNALLDRSSPGVSGSRIRPQRGVAKYREAAAAPLGELQ